MADDHKEKQAKSQSSSGTGTGTGNGKGNGNTADPLTRLRWWALTVERTSLEVVTINPKHFKDIRKILAAAVSDINALQHPRPDKKPVAALKRSEAAAPIAPMTMSEGMVCRLDQDCGDPGLECCEGICVPKNACNVA